MKAIGAKKKQIMRIVISEGIALSFIGFLISSTIGIGIALLGCQVFGGFILDKAIRFDGASYLIAIGIWFLFSLCVCISVSYGSARRSSRMTIKQSQG